MKPELSRFDGGGSQSSEADEKRRRFVVQEFLRRANDIYPMERVYYPACGEDTILTGALPDTTIYYLDRTVKKRDDGVFFNCDYLDAPFEPNTFDGLFLKDVHIRESGFEKEHRKRLEALLNPIKPGGLVIAARFGCKIWELDVPYVKSSGLVKPTNIQFTPKKELEVFQKI